MAHVFDPYYDWLGIAPEEQPANYYRLLGVKLFEQRETVISNAADQRMAFLRTQQQGSHSKESQKILNELAQARVTLLNPERKQAYDEQLRKQIDDKNSIRKSKENPPPVPKQSVVQFPNSSTTSSEKATQIFIPFDVQSELQDTVDHVESDTKFKLSSKTISSNKAKDKKRTKTSNTIDIHRIAQIFCITSVVVAIILGGILFIKSKGKIGKSAIAQQNSSRSNDASPQLVPGERLVKAINGVEFAFRWCPPGEFEMGSPENEEGRDSRYEMQHKVLVKKGFWIMETPVTQAQWKAFMGSNPSGFLGDSQPVEQVSFSDCQAFCNKGIELGLSLAIPSEAQWEYACRAGTTTRYNFGDSADEFYKHGNYCDIRCDATKIKNNKLQDRSHDDGFAFTSDVDYYPPNAWGIKDMHGNVWEWCADAWQANLTGRLDSTPLTIPNAQEHPLHGGSWSSVTNSCRCANRHHAPLNTRVNCIGFRCILEE